MKKNLLLLTAMTLAVSILFSSCNNATEEKKDEKEQTTTIPEGWKEFKDATYNFAIAYPQDWQFKTNDDDAYFSLYKPVKATEVFQPNMNLMIENLPSDAITLEEYENAGKQQIEQNNEFEAKVIESGASTINGISARYMITTMVQYGIKMKMKQTFIKKGKVMLIFSAASLPDGYDEDMKAFDKILNTFRLL